MSLNESLIEEARVDRIGIVFINLLASLQSYPGSVDFP